MSNIFLVTGPPGAGKTCTSRALLERFDKGFHVEVDLFREAVVSGYASPLDEWTPETSRQFELSRRAAIETARIYLNSGFAVAIDDVVFPKVLAEDYKAAFPELVAVMLCPGERVCLERNAARTNKNFDPTVLTDVISSLSREMASKFEGFVRLDNSGLSIFETAEAILSHARPASLTADNEPT